MVLSTDKIIILRREIFAMKSLQIFVYRFWMKPNEVNFRQRKMLIP